MVARVRERILVVERVEEERQGQGPEARLEQQQHPEAEQVRGHRVEDQPDRLDGACRDRAGAPGAEHRGPDAGDHPEGEAADQQVDIRLPVLRPDLLHRRAPVVRRRAAEVEVQEDAAQRVSEHPIVDHRDRDEDDHGEEEAADQEAE
jgi:hypothetical protein